MLKQSFVKRGNQQLLLQFILSPAQRWESSSINPAEHKRLWLCMLFFIIIVITQTLTTVWHAHFSPSNQNQCFSYWTCALLNIRTVQSSSLWQLDFVMMSEMLRLCHAFRILFCLFERPNHTSLGRDYQFDWTMADGECLGNTQTLTDTKLHVQ